MTFDFPLVLSLLLLLLILYLLSIRKVKEHLLITQTFCLTRRDVCNPHIKRKIF